MKRNRLYAVLIILFISAAGFVVLKFKSDEEKKQAVVYPLLERKGLTKQPAEWTKNKQLTTKLLSIIKANPADKKSMIALTNLYILEARASGNYNYYDKAAMKLIDEVLAMEAGNFEALTLKALIQLSQHHFAEGLVTARSAANLYEHNAFVQGILVDGYVEMGKYDSAVMSAEKMMSIRPDLRSYARAAYLREIHGDYAGAIEAMKLAVEAGLPGEEATEWSRVQLGHLYEMIGDMENADFNYAISLSVRKDYVHALAGMARVALASKDYNKAIGFYLRADSLVSDFTFKEELIDVYQLAAKKQKADEIAAVVIEDMNKNSMAASTDESIGHYADKELALAYLKTGNYNKALEHALAEYNRRPENIDVNETLAWVYYIKGENATALPYIETALKTNSANPVLLGRAGLIYEKAGNLTKAQQYLQAAMKNNPNIPEQLKATVSSSLQRLQKNSKV